MRFIDNLGITDPKAVSSIAFAVAFGIITFLHIVFGELAPKSLALLHPEAVSLWTARHSRSEQERAQRAEQEPVNREPMDVDPTREEAGA